MSLCSQSNQLLTERQVITINKCAATTGQDGQTTIRGQQMYFMKRLRTFSRSLKILRNFYSCITVWRTGLQSVHSGAAPPPEVKDVHIKGLSTPEQLIM